MDLSTLDPATFDNTGDVEHLPPEEASDGPERFSALRNSPDRRTGEFAGKVQDVQGDVYVKRPDGSTRKAKEGDILIKGDVVVTDRGSKVQVRDPQGGQVRLGGNTAWDTDTGRHKGDGRISVPVGTLG